jgi:hypothetical protein
MSGIREGFALVAAGVAAATGAAVFLASMGFARGPLEIAYVLVEAAAPIAWWLVGATIVVRAHGHRVGWLLMLAAALSGAVLAGVPVIVGSPAQLASQFAPWAVLIVSAAYGPWFVTITLASTLLFPDGKLPSPAWRWPVLIAVLMVATATVAFALYPGSIAPGLPANPIGIDLLPARALASLFVLDPIGIAGLGLIGAASLVARYARATSDVRAQLKWLVASVVPAALILPISFFEPDQTNTSVADLLWASALLLVPLSIGVAIVRYRLYDINRIISRGLSWAILSGLLIAVYAGAVLLLEGALGRVTQGETVAVAGSTLLVAALFQPLRRRIQAATDRRFNRAGYDAQRTAIEFVESLRDQVDLTSLSRDIADVVETALRPSSIGVWLRQPAPSPSRPTTP